MTSQLFIYGDQPYGDAVPIAQRISHQEFIGPSTGSLDHGDGSQTVPRVRAGLIVTEKAFA
jgi:hypothetical protein